MKRSTTTCLACIRPVFGLIILLFIGTEMQAQNVGIGTAAPQEKLHVAGKLRLDPLAGVDVRLVTTDANGTLDFVTGGTPGQVLTQGATGPAWLDGTDWSLLGNAGTTPATHFIGTTDAQGLAFRTGNVERMRLTDTGLLCVNGTGPYAIDVFSSYASGNQWAVNGYSSGSGGAGYFYANGTGSAMSCFAEGTTGSAGRFFSTSPLPSNSPTIYAYNGSANAPGLLMRSDVANPFAHGVSVEMRAGSSGRGLQIDMDPLTNNIGASILQRGYGFGFTVQSFNNASINPSFASEHAGFSRALMASNYLGTNASQAGYFAQLSTGLTTPAFSNAAAVWGESSGIRAGAFIARGNSVNCTALQGIYNGVAGNYDGIGVLGVFTSNPNYGYGVVGQGNWYGVYANGNSGASGVKSFMIDHPLDPENKYLRHFSIESPEVLNLYRGTVVVDAQGQAQVQLPSYFQAVNADYSYQLTPVGAASVPYIAQEIDAQGRFEIAGAQPGQKVCWVVYADRNDPFVQQNPASLTVEPAKRAADVGLYLQPELYGQPQEKGMLERYKVRPELVKPDPAPAPAVSNEVPVPQAKPLK